MKLSLHGAALSVTGNLHMLEVPGFKLLLDCGLFQGRRDETYRKNRELGFDPKLLSAVLLSYAHIDHSGALPVLQKHKREAWKGRPQAEHTLGRKLVEGWDVVPIFGLPTPRLAQIVKFNGLSAHADRQDLLAYVRAIQPSPSMVILVHGKEKQALSLALAIQTEHPRIEVTVPHAGSTLEI